MTKPISDDEIIKHFKKEAIDLPSTVIDSIILERSVQAINKKNNIFIWKRQWQKKVLPYSSLVAAIAAIAVFAPWHFTSKPMLENESFYTDVTEISSVSSLPNNSRFSVQVEKVKPEQLTASVIPSHQGELSIARRQSNTLSNEEMYQVMSNEPPQANKKSIRDRASKKVLIDRANKQAQQSFTRIIELLDNNNKEEAEIEILTLIRLQPQLKSKLPKKLKLFYHSLPAVDNEKALTVEPE